MFVCAGAIYLAINLAIIGLVRLAETILAPDLRRPRPA